MPSMAVPLTIVLLGVAAWRRLRAGERLGTRTFNTLIPLLPYLIVVSLSVLWSTATDGAVSSAIDLAKNVLVFWVLVELLHNQDTYRATCLALVAVAGTLSLLSIHQ